MKILIVEKVTGSLDFIRSGLHADNYRTETISDMVKGCIKAIKTPFNLIILDVDQQLAEGVSFLADLRSAKMMTPVLTLVENRKDVVVALESGFDACLEKPFSVAELLARIRALLRRVKWDRGAEIFYSDIRLDPVTRRVLRQGEELILSEKEFALLEFMMRNPNQLLTRSTIADNVWPKDDLQRFTNIIDVYITYLRRKLDNGRKNKLIHTERGAGYIMKEA